MRVAIYARVSTAKQSCDSQLETLREFAKSRGWEVFREYVDNGVSGAKTDRPQLNKLMTDAKARKFDALLVWKLDRFGRSLRHLVLALADLQAWNVAFLSYSDNLDLGTAAGRLTFALIGAMAEFERELIKERVRAGVRRAIEAGRKWGRRPARIDLASIPAGTSIRKASSILGINRESVRRAMRKADHPGK